MCGRGRLGPEPREVLVGQYRVIDSFVRVEPPLSESLEPKDYSQPHDAKSQRRSMLLEEASVARRGTAGDRPALLGGEAGRVRTCFGVVTSVAHLLSRETSHVDRSSGDLGRPHPLPSFAPLRTPGHNCLPSDWPAKRR